MSLIQQQLRFWQSSFVIVRMKYFVRKWQHFRFNNKMVVTPPYSYSHHKYYDDNHHDDDEWFGQPQPQLIGMDCDNHYHHDHHDHDHQNSDIITTTTTSTPQQQQLLDQLSLWFAVPKQKISRQKKRMKTTRQRRIPLQKNIITDPRTGQVTLRHRLPFNWKDYLPHALLNNNSSNNSNSNNNNDNSNNSSSASTTN